MGSNRVKLGKYISQADIRNFERNYGEESVVGISTQKEIITTKANLAGVSLASYKMFAPGQFAYVPDTSRRGDKVSLAYNATDKTYLVSSITVVFHVTDPEHLLPDYLFMYFNRPEFDRYARFNSWGSAREAFSWEDMCDIDICLPPLPVQRKYVDVYKAMLANQQSYECGLEDLKLVCDSFIEELRRNIPCEKIGPYIEPCNERNDENTIQLFQGVNVDHVFIDPKRIAEDAENGSVVRTGQFAFNKVMKAHNTRLPIALREGPDCVVSSSYQVFQITNEEKLLPKYLLLWMNRDETQRYAGFISYGTTRDIFSFEDLKEIAIPIPDIKTQQSIADIFTLYQKRCQISERLKAQIKDICPILIQGSLQEGGCNDGKTTQL